MLKTFFLIIITPIAIYSQGRATPASKRDMAIMVWKWTMNLA